MPVSPPRPNGPSLNALRAFEAAARLGGFSKAADELCVTPGAVAQQVRIMEDWIGVPLFERRSQGVKLTNVGESVVTDFSDAFDRLGQAVQTLRTRAVPQEIRIAALPALAQFWLSPRLPALRKRMPGTSISITALEGPPNLKREPYDFSLFLRPEEYGEAFRKICQARIFPVCTPSVAEILDKPTDLQSVPCLQDAVWSTDWSRWLEETLGVGAFIARGPVHSLYGLAIQETLNGAGVLMGHEALVQPLLEKGLLVQPFEQIVALDQFLTLELSPSAFRNEQREQFIKALMER